MWYVEYIAQINGILRDASPLRIVPDLPDCEVVIGSAKCLQMFPSGVEIKINIQGLNNQKRLPQLGQVTLRFFSYISCHNGRRDKGVFLGLFSSHCTGFIVSERSKSDILSMPSFLTSAIAASASTVIPPHGCLQISGQSPHFWLLYKL